MGSCKLARGIVGGPWWSWGHWALKFWWVFFISVGGIPTPSGSRPPALSGSNSSLRGLILHWLRKLWQLPLEQLSYKTMLTLLRTHPHHPSRPITRLKSSRPLKVRHKVLSMRRCSTLLKNDLSFLLYTERNLGSMYGNGYGGCEITGEETKLDWVKFINTFISIETLHLWCSLRVRKCSNWLT